MKMERGLWRPSYYIWISNLMLFSLDSARKVLEVLLSKTVKQVIIFPWEKINEVCSISYWVL